MVENPMPFGPESGLLELNAILEIPEDRRRVAVETMEKIDNWLLGEVDLYQARQKPGGNILIEWTYGDAADHFAKAIDPSWKGYYEIGQEDNCKETGKIRRVFYDMIRLYSSEEVIKGAAEIRRLGIVK
jgi:hypothetical protein